MESIMGSIIAALIIACSNMTVNTNDGYEAANKTKTDCIIRVSKCYAEVSATITTFSTNVIKCSKEVHL